VFQPRQKPAGDPGFEVVDESKPPAKAAPRPAAPPPAAPKKAFSLDDAVRSADPPRRERDRADDRDRRDRDRDRDRDDDRDRRRRDDDDDDDRPRGRSRRDDDYDDYDDDRPRKASKFGLARPGVLLIHISLGLYLGGLALQALLVLIAWMGADIPYGLHAFAGIIGLGGWITALVGFGLMIAGPSRSRGLAIAAAATGFTHLVLAFVVAYNDRGAEFGGSTMRWESLVTDLTALDTLIAGLVYQPKAFGDRLLPLLSGAVELARLILVGLLLGSLARAAKDHRAAAQAKFGWIAAPAAVGIAMLVVLLAAVMAESTVKSATRPDFGTPPSFSSGPNSFQENMRRQEEWRQQQQAEFQRIQDRQRSLGRTLRVWANGSSLLVSALHIGTLVLPLMASFGVWRSIGRRR
jgi:hypothetical protein